ncbi:MAG: LUD domain-containing protein [Planctomycetota bacterium]
MLQGKIDNIARITRALDPVDYPSPVAAPPVPADLATVFEERLNALRAPGDDEPAVVRVADSDRAVEAVAAMCEGTPKAKIIRYGAPPESLRKRDYAIGITPAKALVAATGSVILELPTASHGYSSLLVDLHIVVADTSQLVPDLLKFYEGLAPPGASRPALTNLVCITGCSRTADIEKLLVVPAHGPRRICVVLSETPIEWTALRGRIEA